LKGEGHKASQRSGSKYNATHEHLHFWTCRKYHHHYCNKSIWDDTKAAARQTLNCILKNKKYNVAKKISIWQMEFLHPAMWQVALAWRTIEFAQTSAILEFYLWFRFRPYHRSRHDILHQSAKFYPNRTTLGRKNSHVDFQDGGSPPSWTLGVQ